ncbi:MAG: oligosaccharide flippase family protein, partial [Candidatus Acidiferrales bacterium]
FLLLGDGGLELWGTREAARAESLGVLVARVVPLRLGLATASFALLAVLALNRRLLPNGEALSYVLLLFGLSLFPNALNLKWVFLGREQMGRVVAGLVVGQMVFLGGVLVLVRGSDPRAIYLAAGLRLASEVAMTAYFWVRFRGEYGGIASWRLLAGRPGLTDLDEDRAKRASRWENGGKPPHSIWRAALTMGAVQALGLLNYNFDAVLLGFLRGVRDVGVYNAAYKVLTVALAVPLAYFQGLFPALSRTWSEGATALRVLAERSLRLCAIVAVPIGVGGTLLAEPIIARLFGAQYAESAAPLKLLVWSAVLVILRGSYRHGLNAAGLQNLDLRCAVVSCALNVGLNVALIPRFGVMGAAAATVTADVVWLAMAGWYFSRRITPLGPAAVLVRPFLAGVAMAGTMWFAEPLLWIARGALGVIVYFVALIALAEPEVRGWLRLAVRNESKP